MVAGPARLKRVGLDSNIIGAPAPVGDSIVLVVAALGGPGSTSEAEAGARAAAILVEFTSSIVAGDLA